LHKSRQRKYQVEALVRTFLHSSSSSIVFIPRLDLFIHSSFFSVLFIPGLHLCYLFFDFIYCIHSSSWYFYSFFFLLCFVHSRPSPMLFVLRLHLLYSFLVLIIFIRSSSFSVLFIPGLHLCYLFFDFIYCIHSSSWFFYSFFFLFCFVHFRPSSMLLVLCPKRFSSFFIFI